MFCVCVSQFLRRRWKSLWSTNRWLLYLKVPPGLFFIWESISEGQEHFPGCPGDGILCMENMLDLHHPFSLSSSAPSQEPRSAQGWECPWSYPQLHVSSGQEQSYLRKENNRKLLAHPKDTEVEEKFLRDAQHPQELGQNPTIPLGTSSKELLLSHGAPESAHCRS